MFPLTTGTVATTWLPATLGVLPVRLLVSYVLTLLPTLPYLAVRPHPGL